MVFKFMLKVLLRTSPRALYPQGNRNQSLPFEVLSEAMPFQSPLSKEPSHLIGGLPCAVLAIGIVNMSICILSSTGFLSPK